MINPNKAKAEALLEKKINELEGIGIPASSRGKFNELKVNLIELKKYAGTSDVVIEALKQTCIDGINGIVEDIKTHFQEKISKI